MALTDQQRDVLAELTRAGALTPSYFEGASKPASLPYGRKTMTRNSASAVLRRLMARGLAEKAHPTEPLYRITDAGRDALGS